MPHGHCYLWRPDLIVASLLGNGMHFVAYMVLAGFFLAVTFRGNLGPVALRFRPLFFLLACFIFTCGVTHLNELITLWHGYYYYSLAWCLFSGVVSIGTALTVLLLMKDVLRILRH